MITMAKNKIRRETKINLQDIGNGQYQINDNNGMKLVDGGEDYYIYMKNVTFRKDGTFDGRYLGENPDAIIDDQVQEIQFNEENGKWILEDGSATGTASLAAVRNKSNVIVIIQTTKEKTRISK